MPHNSAPVDMLLDKAVWVALPPPAQSGDLPYATHEGILEIPGLPRLRVVQLSTGQRVIDEESMLAFLEAL